MIKNFTAILIALGLSVGFAQSQNQHENIKESRNVQLNMAADFHSDVNLHTMLKSIQENNTKKDSSLNYEYPSVIDSTALSRSIYTHTDSSKLEIRYAYNASSSEWELDNKFMNLYNDEGELIEYITYDYNSGWEPSSRILAEYNNDMQITKFSQFSWNNQDQWQEYFRWEFDYNNQLRIEARTYTDSSGNSNFGPSVKTEYTYLSNDSLESETLSHYNENMGTYDLNTQTNYYYNNNDRLESEVESYYISGVGWNFDIRKEFTYNNDGLVTTEEEFTYDSQFFSWDENSKTEFTYDGLGNRTVKIFSYYDSGAGAYDPSSKTEYDYSDTLRTQKIYFVHGTEGYKPDFKIEYAYNADGKITSEAEFDWNENTSIWTKLEKKETEYNQHGDKIIIRDYVGEQTGALWELDEKTFNYYSLANSSNEILSSQNIVEVYPNPASNYVKFSLKEVEHNLRNLRIYDSNGKMVFTRNFKHNDADNTVKWNSSAYSPGTYFAIIRTDKDEYSRKIVVK
ncbi:MAG TPA: T9SS type A sorting domain-containing protein [Bacteroidales bacterium]|nr:T9SS type A sorting domain-containing protein [Bacteroidales bacterium]